MKKYAFLLSPKWAQYLFFTIFFSSCSYLLGNWQYERHVKRVEEINIINKNFYQKVTNFSDIKNYFDDLPKHKQWTHFTVTGRYIADDQKIVRNRTKDGIVGFEVITPFKVKDDSCIIIVNRGWLTSGMKKYGYPDLIPKPYYGDITITGWIKDGETKISKKAPEGQISAINLSEYQKMLPYKIGQSAYAILDCEYIGMKNKEVNDNILKKLNNRPNVDYKSHLSYAWQWYSFSVLSIIGFIYCIIYKSNDRQNN